MQDFFREIRPGRNEDVLVGLETGDDAGVYRLSTELALVQTADYITPFTDDPYLFGRVAAANSISDVYAMGGQPKTVLNLCMFPAKVDRETLLRVLQGGLEKTQESGALLLGGHTIRDEQMKYGLSVNGIVHPARFTPNSGARPGDRFILTKPVGSGAQINAFRRGRIDARAFHLVGEKMAELNRTAAETMVEFGAGGATDITGFGFGGHALMLARASKLGIRIFFDRIPLFPETLELIGTGFMPGLSLANGEFTGDSIVFGSSFSEADRNLLSDPQTSGGLFFGVRPGDTDACLEKLHERGVSDARIVAETFETDRPHLEIVRG